MSHASPPPPATSEAFLSVCDCYGSLDRLSSLRIAAAALAVNVQSSQQQQQQQETAGEGSRELLRAPPPFPPHAREASRKGAGALYAALRGLRQVWLQQALHSWHVSAVLLAQEAEEDAPPPPPPAPPAPPSYAEKINEMAIRLRMLTDENAILQTTQTALEVSHAKRTAQLQRQVEALQRALVLSEQQLTHEREANAASRSSRHNPDDDDHATEDGDDFRVVGEDTDDVAHGHEDSEPESEQAEAALERVSPGSWLRALSPFTPTNLRRSAEGS